MRRPLHIAQLPVSWMTSGTEQQVLDLSGELVAGGDRVSVIAPAGERLERLRVEAAARGANVEKIGPLFFGNWLARQRTPLQLGEVLRRLRPDILHVHYAHLYWHPRLIPIARSAGVRRIIRTEHNPILKPATPLQRVLVRTLDHYVQRITFVSSDNYRKHQNFCGRPLRKCIVVPNAIEPSAVVQSLSDEHRHSIRAKLGLPARAVIAVKIGAYDLRQGYVDFVEAAANAGVAPQLHFVVLGDCPDRDSTLALASQLGVGPRVHFLGRRDDVRSILPAFDMFVQSSHYEGMSVSMLEALAAGLPMVTTRVDGVSDVLPGERGALFADIHDVSALGRAMGRLALNPQLRRDLAAISRARVLEGFSLRGVSARWRSLYADVMAEQP